MKEFKPGLIFIGPDHPDFHAEDWVLGASPYKREILFPDGNAEKYLPTPERQASRIYDPYSCVANSCHNCIETISMRKMELDPEVKLILQKLEILDENGRPNLSDRFLAKVSGTIPGQGNSLRAVAEAIRKFGFVAEKFWPKTENMPQDEYYAEPTPEVYAKAKEALEYFDIHHEDVPRDNNGFGTRPYSRPDQLKEARKYGGAVQVCVDGRYEYENGLVGGEAVGKVLNYNHATTNYNDEPSQLPPNPGSFNTVEHIFDTYEPFKKKFVPDYQFGMPKIFFITKKKVIMLPKIYKEKDKSALYALNPRKQKLQAFGDGEQPGGDTFLTLYGVESYKDVPRVKDPKTGDDWEQGQLPFPIDNILLTSVSTSSVGAVIANIATE